MATIKNIEGMSDTDLRRELENGGKFVIFTYAISIIVMTFRQSSSIYFIRPGESAFKYGWGFLLISLVFGWWGIPWGPIYTIGSIVTNLSGGKDVTTEVLQAIVQPVQAPIAPGTHEAPLPPAQGV